ncbi:iron(III) transport system permease protein [Anoxybacillus tepidamans]|uniref:Iron(III) transport system permease protein n=1 Tax=Anoxybacteroides tepidamans TaxID=265948 RepID=A0A7W8IT44_9BACL|nr:iron ABC transporter permease [Anoxybacillus tepidamans]MBB5326194.1 iron(III) transport system permease protein [Anoxybacillus tepidamans]
MQLIRHAKQHLNIWAILSLVFVAVILFPNLLIGFKFFTEPNENWEHIKFYLMRDYINNTATILIFTAILTILIGTSLAWLIIMYEFPLRGFFRWGLILPLAIPPYIGAYTYHGLLNYTGVIQTTLRNTFDIQVNQSYFNIMSTQGAVFIFTLFLYPYVYTITKSFFQYQSASLIENAILLGSSPTSTFFRVALPLSRATIVGSVTLVMLEVLNDYGVVSYFGIQTFSTAIFRTWYGMKDLDSALKLAGTLMFIVIVVLILEKMLRGRKRYSYASTKVRPIHPKRLKGWKGWLLFAYSFAIFSIAFLVPLAQLLYWAFMTYETIWSQAFFQLAKNSIFVASITSTIIISIALIIANFTRMHQSLFTKLVSRVTTLGYSIPGAAIAIAIITIFISIDTFLAKWDTGIVLRTSLVMLISAYVIRFLAIGYNSVEAGFEKIGNTFTEASRLLGASTIRTFFMVDLPLMKNAIAAGFILVFVDILKELPLTLFLQPFNFATLATQAFKYANDERVQEASIASLLIILISATAIFIFHRVLEKKEAN